MTVSVSSFSACDYRLRFQGVQATQAAEKRLMMGYELESTLKHDIEKEQDPYLGELPEDLASSTQSPEADRRTLEAIDTLADTLNQRRPWQMTARLSDQPVTLWHLGKGGFGHIYKLSTRSKDYALKIFRPKQEVERKMRRELFLQALQAGDNPWGEAVDQSIYAAQLDNNPYREGAVGLFLRNKPVWDIARYHVGNPGKGWQLTELVDHRVDLARRKQEKPYRLNEVGLKFCDDPGTLARILSLNGLLEFLPVFRHLGNRIQGIRVDYGAMEGSYRVPKKTGR